MPFKAYILTVSDTLAQAMSASNPIQTTNTSGLTLRESLQQHSSKQFSVEEEAVVADDIADIQRTIKRWIAARADLILTTGGTGFGTRDVTPEAIAPLVSKPTPGLTHLLLSHSLQKTPMAVLSRPVTGIALHAPLPQSTPETQQTGAIIVTLPGSTRAVGECMDALLGDSVLQHALELVSGGSGSRQHASMQGPGGGRDGAKASHTGLSGTETDTGSARPRTEQREESSGYVTRDPGGPASRHRKSPYPILSLDAALNLIAEHTPSPRQTHEASIDRKLIGAILARDVTARTDLPLRPTTNVDGYAVSAHHTPPGPYRVSASNAGFEAGSVQRINTGQGLPSGADAVVMVEDTELLESSDDGEERYIKVLAQVDAGENVRKAGSDVKQGSVILQAGQRLSELGGELGTLAFLGYPKVTIHTKPKVAILSTGNELADIAAPKQTDAWGFRIWDANRPGLRAAIESAGYEVVDLGIVHDDRQATVDALRRGLEEAEVVLTTGGTSMGESDLLKPIIERDLGGKIHFGRVAMKPGKPTTFATIPRESSDRVVFALPGNPASALVCFYVFVLPSLRKLCGHHASIAPSGQGRSWSVPRVKLRLENAMKLDPRPEFHRAVVYPDANGRLVARSTGSQRSSGMHSMATANALVCVPALDGSPGSPTQLQAGSEALAMLIGSIL
ncbi:Molybdopterin biosynthesis protein [Ceraceosorus bombacis]|uniref:Molybdopterin biosynthesis protein n=1 Tax=Ceraceosorus bombacis TaxID=401625 RepID=A0A0P1BN23_9BASI|nr:Molybdopterin biosynthesis protein [Ceraceosorus bombacis]